MQLRPYQIDIIDQTRELMKQGARTVLIQAPTGSGKTALTASMLRTAAQKDMPSLFLCHRRELIIQSSKAFEKMNIGHGIIAAGFPFSARPMVQIGSIQTIGNRIHKIRKPKLIVFDECHHWAARTWTKVYEAFPEAYIIGLTATPQRLDGSGLSKYVSRMVKGPTVQWLIENGFLSPYKIFAPANIDLSNVHTRMGDFANDELSKALDKPTITGDAIKEYKKYANGKRAIVRGVSIKHSEHIAEQFNKEGIPARHLDGKTPTIQRDLAMAAFRRGEILILSNVDLFSEGLDVPAVECVIDLRPTKSLTLALQFWGRALRPMEGKTAIIIDHAGNCQRHGFPCDERNWSLEGREKKKKEDTGPMIRLCPQCFYACRAWMKQCPECKNEFVVQAREVDHVKGDLAEVDITMFRKNKRKEEGMAKTLEELKELGKQRGYSPGWAHVRFNSRNKGKDNW